MYVRYYLTLAVVTVGVFTLAGLSTGCPDSNGWFISNVTSMCYKGLHPATFSYADAQKRCNELRSNLFQFNRGDDGKVFEDLQNELQRYYKTIEFQQQSWIGLTDRAAVGEYVYLNGFLPKDIPRNIEVYCPDAVPRCKPAYRCVTLDLSERSKPNGKQVRSGHCEDDKFPAICYAPQGGTDTFDKIPALGAQSVAGSLVVLLFASFLSATANRLLVHC